MKFSFTLITALAAGLSAASPLLGLPTTSNTCPLLVDSAITASVITLKGVLVSFVPGPLGLATDAGARCFRQTVGCTFQPAPSTPLPPASLDCTGLVQTALDAAVVTLNGVLALVAPTTYQAGVDAGVKCFKEAYGCAVPPTVPMGASS